MPADTSAETILYGQGGARANTARQITPRPLMHPSGPAAPVAHYVCPDCGEVRKLPSDGKADERPWCSHSSNYFWSQPTFPDHDWTQMEYAEVRLGKPHCNGEAWADPLMGDAEED